VSNDFCEHGAASMSEDLRSRSPHGTVGALILDTAPAPEAVDDPSEIPRRRRFRRAKAAPADQPRHFPCFDGLRAVAAVLVVLVHTSFASGFTLRSATGIYTARFELGVSVFFLISGFLLYRPFAASHIAGGPPPATGRFWLRRFLRIMPAYWLAFAITGYVMHGGDHQLVHGWRALLVYLGLLQVYFPSQALTGITQAWSLCTEIAFYLFLPLFALVISHRRRSDRNQLARELIGVGVLFVTGLGLRFWLLHVHTALASVMLEWLPTCFDLFALGMFLAIMSSWLVHRDLRPRWLWNPVVPWVSWALAFTMLWSVSHLGIPLLPLKHASPWRGLVEELLYGLFALFLLLPAVFGPQRKGTIRRFLQFPPVVAVGVVSYGVYLWHQAWLNLFVDWTGALFKVAFPETFGVVIALALATATLSYVFVERPLLRLKGRLAWWRPPRLLLPAVVDRRAQDGELLGERPGLVLETTDLPAQVDAHHQQEQRREHGQQRGGTDDAEGAGHVVEQPR
jgi:peptidoglycan/LPS O-acetylase OafA/YrhL